MRLSLKPKSRLAWVEGKVNRRAEHASICYGESHRPVALVPPNKRHSFTVEFILKARPNDVRSGRILEDVRRELQFYLLDVIGPDSWSFVQFHCDTPANTRSIVHWNWHPKPAGVATNGAIR